MLGIYIVYLVLKTIPHHTGYHNCTNKKRYIERLSHLLNYNWRQNLSPGQLDLKAVLFPYHSAKSGRRNG